MITEHAYYIPSQKIVRGTIDPDVIAGLYAAYMRALPVDQDPGRFDGTSIVKRGDVAGLEVLTTIGKVTTRNAV